MPKVYSDLYLEGQLIYNNNPTSGYVLTTDDFGLVSWTASTTSLVENITSSELLIKRDSSLLTPGMKYFMIDINSWVDALDVNVLSRSGTRYMQVCNNTCYAGYPIYQPSTGKYIRGVWKSTLSPASGDKVVWGGKLWRNLYGSVGSFLDEYSLDSNWELIMDDPILHYYKTFDVVFGEWMNIISQSDERGNVIVYNQYYNYIDITDWGNSRISNNKCSGIFNNSTVGNISGNIISGYISANIGVNIVSNKISDNEGSIYNNNTPQISYNNINGGIYDNIVSGGIINNSGSSTIIRGNEVAIIRGNINAKNIEYNSLNYYIEYNDMNNYDISNNGNMGDISNNIMIGNISMNNNNGVISYNICSGITDNINGPISYNSNIGTIEYNTNVGGISSNSNNGEISNNSNNGEIVKNSNTGMISLNSNTSNISFNTNGGYITGNSNLGSVDGNGGACNITDNSNTDSIINNICCGDINNNSNSGGIVSNLVTGLPTSLFGFSAIGNNGSSVTTIALNIIKLFIYTNNNVGSVSNNKAQNIGGTIM